MLGAVTARGQDTTATAVAIDQAIADRGNTATVRVLYHRSAFPAIVDRFQKDPAALARHVLRNSPGWRAERIDSAMHGEKTIEVELVTPMPVLVLYATSVAWPDARVGRALREWSRRRSGIAVAVNR